MQIPPPYDWLYGEPGPRMLLEVVKLYGTKEKPGPGDNEVILEWAHELELPDYTHDEIPWCGLFMAIVAYRANLDRRPERNPPRLYLSALQWASFGVSVPKGAAALGDVLVFKRKGGGHVGLYVGHDTSAFHVLGGNQSDRVSITRLSRNRLVAVRRPAYRAQPANVRPIPLTASGSLSVNEA